jgi:hypothetical protein
MDVEFHIGSLLNGAVFAIAGILLLAIVAHVLLGVIGKVRGIDLWDEIAGKQNLPLALYAGLLTLGVAIIIAAALH